MKQRAVLALAVIFSAAASVAATSARARSSEDLNSDEVLAEAAASNQAFRDRVAKAAERKALLVRLGKAEALTASERQALGAQQQVLIALAQEQQALESKLNSMEASARASSSDGIVEEKGTMSSLAEKTALVRQKAQPEHPPLYEVATKRAKKVIGDVATQSAEKEVVSTGSIAAESVKQLAQPGTPPKKEGSKFMLHMRESEKEFWERYNNAFWEKMIGIATYLVQILIVAVVYMQFCKQSNIPKLPESQVRTEEFQFGAFDASDIMRDCQMCLCALCCPWVRWADTASAPHISFLAFFPALFITALLASAGTITFGLSIPILLLIVVLCRQRIREAYGLPSGNCAVLSGDCLLWICCPCCAMVQEARQVEYVDMPMQVYGP